jgi:hypothetical protein
MVLRLPALSKAAFPFVILAAVGMLPTAPQAADTDRCAQKARIHMVELAIPRDDIESIRIIESISLGNERGSDAGVDAWVRLKSCSGWLVINMSPACFVRQSYTRGDCRIDGLSNY